MMTLAAPGIAGFDLEHAPCGALTLSEDLLVVSANQTFADMLDMPLCDLINRPLDSLLTPANRLMFHLQTLSLLHVHGHVEEISLTLTTVSGLHIPVLFNAIQRAHGSGIMTECIVMRMNERKRLEDELFRVKKATEQVPGTVYQFLRRADGTTCFPYASEGIRHIYGLSPMQVQQNAELVFERIHPDDLDNISNSITDSADNLSRWQQQYRVNLPRLGMRWLEGQATPEARADGSVLWHGYIYDITDRKNLEAALANENERTRVTLHSIGDAVITTDALEKVEYLNPIAERLTGWNQADATGLPVSTVFNIVNQHTRQTAKNPIAHCLAERSIVGLARDTVLISKDGTEYAVEDSAAPIFTADGILTGVVMVFRDVTDQRILRQEVEHRASHDHLTGLPNRAEFERLSKQMFLSSIDTHALHTLCCIDLDQFKIVNDSCGHAAGDMLLRQVSTLLLKSVRFNDTVARLGGDEFALLLENCDLEAGYRIAQGVCERVADMRFQYDGRSFRVGASIGVAPLDRRWNSVEAAQQAADAACFAAKDAGRSRVHVYEEQDQSLQKQHAQMQWATILQQAIDDDHFELFAQPITALATGTESGLHFEVLLRMRDHSGELIPPGTFIPAAERYGVITQIDRWVVRQVCSWMTAQREHIDRIHTIAINLSGKSIGDHSFHRYVGELLDSSGIAAHKLCFEITETAAIENMSTALDFFQALRQRGARISLDDFGSGMSSMAYLRSLPVDYVKIDGQFVKDIVTDPVDRAMVRSINEIAHLMGKQTIAEFVESEAILLLLQELGVDFSQGYHTGKPRPIDQIWR